MSVVNSDINSKIEISEVISKDSAFPNKSFLDSSGGIDILYKEESDDDESISDSGSIVFDHTNISNLRENMNTEHNSNSVDNHNNSGILTLDTDTVDTNYLKELKITADVTVGTSKDISSSGDNNDSDNENTNSSLEVLNDSDSEDQLIDNLLDMGNDNAFENQRDTAMNSTYKNKYGSYDRESKEVKGRPSACVFVASLSSNLSDDILCQSVTNHFKQWGKMSLVKVLRDPANRPYAFVQYEKDEDADKAITEGQHSILNGRTVRCEKARVNRTLFLQLSNSGITEKTMMKLTTRFGEVERLVAVNENFDVINSSNTKLAYKNWFCKFIYRQDAISAFANLKTKPLWNVEWAQNLDDEYSNVPEVTIDKYSIFVGQLDPRISKEEMIERFEKHGKIKEAILVNRLLSNFAFIKFKTKEAAASAVERENHSMFKFKTIHVQYREMYNNYRRKNSNDYGLKLNLAPPPINFKRRYSFNNDYKPINLQNHRIRNNSYGNGLKSKFNSTPETFAQVMKLKHQYQQNPRLINDGYKTIRSGTGVTQKRFASFDSAKDKYELYTPVKKDMDVDPKNINQCESDVVENVNEIKIRPKSGNEFEFNGMQEHLASIKLSHKLPQDKQERTTEIEESENATSQCVGEHNSSSTRDNVTFSSGSPLTGYTYSSYDNGEVEALNLNDDNHLKNPAPYQYRYCYYYPPKDIPYLNPQMHASILQNEPVETSKTFPPPLSGAGYYYPYPNYPLPGTPNGQMTMYPMYLYYNPVAMLDTVPSVNRIPPNNSEGN